MLVPCPSRTWCKGARLNNPTVIVIVVAGSWIGGIGVRLTALEGRKREFPRVTVCTMSQSVAGLEKKGERGGEGAATWCCCAMSHVPDGLGVFLAQVRPWGTFHYCHRVQATHCHPRSNQGQPQGIKDGHREAKSVPSPGKYRILRQFFHQVILTPQSLRGRGFESHRFQIAVSDWNLWKCGRVV